MPTIQVLDSHVADLIAAGEVVERPASVAKELMENAIDAGASKVTVEISHGGLTFLRVTDDGKGIPAGELKTAFLRHATSKLRTAYDLEAIGTLGFRGEALAAISAVSRVEVMTRTADAPLGASLSLEGGVPGEIEEAGCPLGTTMVVRDLFYNTPARLKFMKKDSAEGAAVFAVVQRVALSHPEVSVKFIRDGKQELLTPGDGALQSAVYAVLGRELALGFREVKSGGDGIKVTGFVSQPACCRASRNWQFFFVNGRQVKSRLLMAALEQAYQCTTPSSPSWRGTAAIPRPPSPLPGPSRLLARPPCPDCPPRPTASSPWLTWPRPALLPNPVLPGRRLPPPRPGLLSRKRPPMWKAVWKTWWRKWTTPYTLWKTLWTKWIRFRRKPY